MRFTTSISELSVNELRAVARGLIPCEVTDCDFLQTLADHHCFILNSWVVRAQPCGSLARVVKLSYDLRGNLDKVRILLGVAREFGRAKHRGFGFGSRFST
ncbi:MAG TPA: hypothetical protein VM008_20550 [Phycisphaerae bacterium]|nr:hypothetical protein [Phycisphaerae bacterium]